MGFIRRLIYSFKLHRMSAAELEQELIKSLNELEDRS